MGGGGDGGLNAEDETELEDEDDEDEDDNEESDSRWTPNYQTSTLLHHTHSSTSFTLVTTFQSIMNTKLSQHGFWHFEVNLKLTCRLWGIV